MLAPSASIPPSPKRKACNIKATETDIDVAYGPIRIANKTEPTACAVVPPGTGTLNIIIKNDNEDATPSIGAISLLSLTASLTFFTE